MNQQGKKKSPGRPFQKGQSGNPAGRPRKGNTLAEAIRSGVSPEKIYQRVLEILASDDEKAAMQAANFLADRGWGKAPQTLEVTSEGGVVAGLDASKLSDEELARLQDLIRKARPANDGG